MSRQKNGHYCWCCRRIRPHERFSGRNHARRLCRECARLPADEREHRQGERDVERLLHGGFHMPRSPRRNRRTLSAAPVAGKAKAREEWDPSWGEWNAVVEEAGDEHGKYVLREADWEPPYQAPASAQPTPGRPHRTGVV